MDILRAQLLTHLPVFWLLFVAVLVLGFEVLAQILPSFCFEVIFPGPQKTKPKKKLQFLAMNEDCELFEELKKQLLISDEIQNQKLLDLFNSC